MNVNDSTSSLNFHMQVLLRKYISDIKIGSSIVLALNPVMGKFLISPFSSGQSVEFECKKERITLTSSEKFHGVCCE